MSFWDLRLYTHNVRIYVVVAILIWFLYIYVFPAPFLKEEWIPLNKLPVYEKLPQCFDTTDGIECFRRYRPELVKQSKRVLSTESYTNFERCLSSLSNSSNDMSLILNIQSCLYKASKTASPSSSGNLLGKFSMLLLSLLMALMIALHILFVARNQRILANASCRIEVLSTTTDKLFNMVMTLVEKQKQVCDAATSFIQKHEENIDVENSSAKDYVCEELGILNDSILSVKNAFEDMQHNFTLVPLAPIGIFSGSSGTQDALEYNFPIDRNQQELSSRLPQVSKSVDSRFFNENRETENWINSKNEITQSYKKNCKLKQKNNAKSSFDISTTIGRQAWKSYVKENLNSSVNSYLGCIKKEETKDGSQILKPVDQNQADCSISENPQIRYRDLVKSDCNNKPFKRLFVPGRGWISLRKLEEEEKKYGSMSFVNNQPEQKVEV